MAVMVLQENVLDYRRDSTVLGEIGHQIGILLLNHSGKQRSCKPKV